MNKPPLMGGLLKTKNIESAFNDEIIELSINMEN